MSADIPTASSHRKGYSVCGLLRAVAGNGLIARPRRASRHPHIYVLMAGFVLLALVAACGSDTEPDATATSPPTAAATSPPPQPPHRLPPFQPHHRPQPPQPRHRPSCRRLSRPPSPQRMTSTPTSKTSLSRTSPFRWARLSRGPIRTPRSTHPPLVSLITRPVFGAAVY